MWLVRFATKHLDFIEVQAMRFEAGEMETTPGQWSGSY